MYLNIAQDWPALILAVLFLGFLVYAVMQSRKNQEKDKEAEKK